MAVSIWAHIFAIVACIVSAKAARINHDRLVKEMKTRNVTDAIVESTWELTVPSSRHFGENGFSVVMEDLAVETCNVKNKDGMDWYEVKVQLEKVPHFTDLLQKTIAEKAGNGPLPAKTYSNGQIYKPLQVQPNGYFEHVGILGETVISVQWSRLKGPKSGSAAMKFRRFVKQTLGEGNSREVGEDNLIHVGAHFTGEEGENIYDQMTHAHIVSYQPLTQDQIESIAANALDFSTVSKV
mmetsp:Transcript_64113/g.99978  ORF Transcript_64113/g.99978 Transcript_64113/m.99978 type:complete len:239 (-) Transcript_64113:146-862(-)